MGQLVIYQKFNKDIPRLSTRGRVLRDFEGLVGVWTCLLEVREINKITLNKDKRLKESFFGQSNNAIQLDRRLVKQVQELMQLLSLSFRKYLIGFLLASNVVASVLPSEQPNTRNRLLESQTKIASNIAVQVSCFNLWW